MTLLMIVIPHDQEFSSKHTQEPDMRTTAGVPVMSLFL
jgi:hypothetical protein